MALEMLRAHWKAFVLVALAVGVAALFLGPAIMTPAYGVLAPLAPVVAWLALAEIFPAAVAASVAGFDVATHALMLAMFVLFDTTLCTLAGIAGFYLLAMFRPGPAPTA